MTDSPSSRSRITREELHQAVCSEPMRTVAKRFGVSDVALAKRCRRMAIPLPGRGYWAKKAVGKKVRPISLPKAIPAKRSSRLKSAFGERCQSNPLRLNCVKVPCGIRKDLKLYQKTRSLSQRLSRSREKRSDIREPA